MAVAKPSPAASKTTAKPPLAPAVAKPAVAVAKPVGKRTVDAETRARMIADAAYYIAEKRGFSHGHHDADWATAEKQIDALLARGT